MSLYHSGRFVANHSPWTYINTAGTTTNSLYGTTIIVGCFLSLTIQIHRASPRFEQGAQNCLSLKTHGAQNFWITMGGTSVEISSQYPVWNQHNNMCRTRRSRARDRDHSCVHRHRDKDSSSRHIRCSTPARRPAYIDSAHLSLIRCATNTNASRPNDAFSRYTSRAGQIHALPRKVCSLILRELNVHPGNARSAYKLTRH
jgi:hypothetical protein